jgi:hypothetical protein
VRRARFARMRRLDSLSMAISCELRLRACDFCVTTVAPTATPHKLETKRARPLHLSILPTGARCLRVQLHEVSPDDAPVAGSGPGTAARFEGGVLTLASAANIGGGAYGGNKVIFSVTPTYHGLHPVRGVQSDGLQLSGLRRRRRAASRGCLHRARAQLQPRRVEPRRGCTRRAALGWYGAQFDGAVLSEVLVFPDRLCSGD